ncbi:MAG TPA: nucleotidyltransferase family protein [Gammaproteobacteria bacterium]
MTGEIVGILLAAGQGSRFGSDKLRHPLPDGTPMALAAALNLLPAVDRVIAVVRPGSPRLATLLAAAGCETVIAAAAQGGMGHTLAAGVRASAAAAGWVVTLADMPFIAPDSHLMVATRLRSGASLLACEFNGRRGHPVGFAREWFSQLVALRGDHGGKPILSAHRQALMLCPVDDPGVVWDIDRPEDLKAAVFGAF